MTDKKIKVNRTTQRTIEMLELIASNPKGLTLNEIVTSMDIPKSSGFDILHTLAYLNMVEKVDEDGKTYKIGAKSFVIGSKYINNTDLIDMARPHIEKIGQKYKKCVFIGKENQDKVVYIHKFEPADADVLATCTIGTQNEFYNTALGRCVLAYKPNYKEIIHDLCLEGKIANEEKFLADIETVRTQKYTISDEEHEKMVFCIAIPIFDYNNKLIVAISLSGVYQSKENFKEELVDMKAMGETISRAMGYEGAY